MDPTQLNRIEVAIDKLTIISGNLDKLLGVHEQRLNTQEKQLTSFETNLEKRREVYESNFNDLNERMRKEDKIIADDLAEKVEKNNARISKLENKVYYISGGICIVTFILTYGQSFIHLLQVLNSSK